MGPAVEPEEAEVGVAAEAQAVALEPGHAGLRIIFKRGCTEPRRAI